MAINTSLLVASPTFQEALVDKTGIPMANGTVTCYQDMSRTTLKNWYYQSGTPGNYTYIKLPNPLQLSAAGTVCDINGVDTIPFFYPFSELDQGESQKYYITIVNETQTNQITRANFPPNSASGGGGNGGNGVNTNNLIVNGGFWRNLQPNTLNVTPYTSIDLTNSTQIVVSPSQHDGFQYPDVTFFKTNTTATDTLTFTPFPFVPIGSTTNTILINDITPEYYINHACTVAGSGQTQKAYFFPISLHVNTLANVSFTATIQAQNNGSVGAGQNVIKLFIYQDTGQGTTGITDEIAVLNLSTGWQKCIVSSSSNAVESNV